MTDIVSPMRSVLYVEWNYSDSRPGILLLAGENFNDHALVLLVHESVVWLRCIGIFWNVGLTRLRPHLNLYRDHLRKTLRADRCLELFGIKVAVGISRLAYLAVETILQHGRIAF